MKILIPFSILFLVLLSIFSTGCQERKPSLYLNEINYGSDFCEYLVFEDKNMEVVIDTICILCTRPLIWDSIPPQYNCIPEKAFKYIYRQEYNPADTSFTYYPMYIEKISQYCRDCPQGKKQFKQAYFGQIN